MVGMSTIPSDRKAQAKHSVLCKLYEQYADNPFVATAEAIAKGYAISKIDGPLPFADAVGLVYATFDAASAWHKYLTK